MPRDRTLERLRAGPSRRVLAGQSGRAVGNNWRAGLARVDGRLGGHPACRYTPRRGLAGRGDAGGRPRASYDWGCFRLRLDTPAWQARLIEMAVRLRVRLFRLPYGDQAMFFRRATLEALGGIPAVPLMEDVILARRFARRGRAVPVGRAGRDVGPSLGTRRVGAADCNQPVAVDEVPDGRATGTVGRGLRRDTTMLIRTTPTIPTREITDERLYLDRRAFIRASVGAAAGGVAGALLPFDEARAPGRRRPRQRAQESAQHDRREAQLVRGHHQLQQLLRVRHRQERPEGQQRQVQAGAVDGEDRRRGRQARRLHARGSAQAIPARGAGLPPPLRRGVVDGDSVGRLPARRPAEGGGALGRRRSSSSSRRCSGPARCRGCGIRCSSGRIARACASTRRSIR